MFTCTQTLCNMEECLNALKAPKRNEGQGRRDEAVPLAHVESVMVPSDVQDAALRQP